VLGSFAYFFFPDLPHALAGFYRVLRPQGKVAFNNRRRQIFTIGTKPVV